MHQDENYFLKNNYYHNKSLMGQQFAEIDAQVGIMFVDAKFFTDIAAHIVVAPHLDIRAHFLAFQSKGIQTAVIDFPFGESMLFQMFDELGMRGCKRESGGIHKDFPIRNQGIHFLM